MTLYYNPKTEKFESARATYTSEEIQAYRDAGFPIEVRYND